MDKKLIFLMAFLGVGVLVMAVNLSLPEVIVGPQIKVFLLFIALFMSVLGFSVRFYSYLVGPIIKHMSRHVILSAEDAYWISTSQDVIIHRQGLEFVATVFIKIPTYMSATTMDAAAKLDFTKQVARLVALSREPVKFTSQMYMMNKDNYIKTLRDTINEIDMMEASLQTGSKVSEPERVIRGKSSMWHHMLDNVTSAPSFELISYASVSARSLKEFEAAAEAQQRARDIISGVGAIFGVVASIITGDELLKFVEPEYTTPYSTVTEQLSRSVREQVI
jgi:hypothetical protein